MWNTLVDKMLEGFLLMLEHFGLARRLQSEGFDPASEHLPETLWPEG
jgi:hypothetical protein